MTNWSMENWGPDPVAVSHFCSSNDPPLESLPLQYCVHNQFCEEGSKEPVFIAFVTFGAVFAIAATVYITYAILCYWIPEKFIRLPEDKRKEFILSLVPKREHRLFLAAKLREQEEQAGIIHRQSASLTAPEVQA